MSYPIYVKNSQIHEQIDEELTKSIRKFPTWPTDAIHASAVLQEEAGEIVKAVNEATYEGGSIEEVRKEALQTAAMCIRFLKSIDQYKFEPCEQHKQD